MTEAKYWKKRDDGRIACELCPQACVIPEGGHGVCLGRVNRDGALIATNFAECVSVAMDPIEKKPLYHVCPGRQVLSIACNGCNLRCDFCQNWSISQTKARTTPLPPAELVRLAVESGSFGVAYTYTEPLVWFEYLLQAGALVREAGIKNMLVTNGVLNEAPMRELLPLIDAMNVDLKSMSPSFYRDYCHIDGAEAVQRTIRLAAEQCLVEVTNLIIPGLNDSDEDLRALVDFVAGVDPAIPLHFSRYFPTYKMSIEPTPVETLVRARDIAREKLHYVYVGNVRLDDDSDTRCPTDGHLLVRRTGYSAEVVGVEYGKCAGCGRETDFLWCEEGAGAE
jgi:pyruvate formate lyase activating enzyme